MHEDKKNLEELETGLRRAIDRLVAQATREGRDDIVRALDTLAEELSQD